MKLAWGAKVSPLFCQRLVALCLRLDLVPDWLMACIAFETGRTFRADTVNRVSGATGLIQFMPSTARGMGTTVEALARKTPEEQLDDVERYLREHGAAKVVTLADLYMTILWPKAVGRPDDEAIFVAGSSAYAQNAALDIDKDHQVSKKEAAAYVAAQLEAGLREENVAEVIEEAASKPQEKPMGIAMILSMLGPIIGQLIPQVAAILKPSEVGQRNLGLAQVALNTIVQAAGVAKAGEEATLASTAAAVEKMQGDAALLAQVKAAVLTQKDIMEVLEIGPGIQKAVEHSIVMQTAERPFWYNPLVWVTAGFFPMMYMVTAAVLFLSNTGIDSTGMLKEGAKWYTVLGFDPSTRSGLVNLIVGFIFGGVTAVWFGTTAQRSTSTTTTPTSTTTTSSK